MGRYADGLLSEGERVVLRARQHWLAPALEAKWAWAMVVASFVLLWLVIGLKPDDGLRSVLGPVLLILLVGGLGWLAFVYANWMSQDYLVTTRRVLKVEGILTKKSADSSLEKINDAVLEQTLLGRWLGYGDLEILTASEISVDVYHRLKDAPGFKRTMLDAKHRLEDDVSAPPSPPLRTSTPEGGSSATPMPAAMAERRQMTAAEITAAVRDLADLRDRGALGPEEYEAKKQELLGRL